MNFQQQPVKNPSRYTVTTALPYANGPIHIGHLAGVYIPADIYVRYLRSNQRDVVFIGGSDEHGVPITIKARQEGVSPQAIVDRYHSIIKASFETFGISFDIYSRTSSDVHHQTAADFFKTLYDKGCFIEQNSQQYYDPEQHQFLADRYIVGTCPHCRNERAYGDQCEQCGTSLNATDLIDPKSTISGQKPILKETTHWYLPLNTYEPFFRHWILEGHKHDWKTNVYGQCKSWIDLGLQPRAVTRDLNWGVPVPLEHAQGKVLYVWFDAPIGYISATKELRDDWERYWKDPETKLLHFIGKDNIVFHCLIFPAMLKAEGSYILPENVPANEFLNLEGDKISTSRNWAVWLHEYLEEFPNQQDVLRYVLCANAPETKDNDFTWKDFQTRNNSELVAILGNFVNRTLVLTHKYFEGKIPALDNLLPIDQTLLDEMSTYPDRIADSLEHYRFREGLNEMMNLARLGNKYLTETEPWKVYNVDPQRVATILRCALELCARLSIVAEPFLPFTTLKLNGMIGLKPQPWNEAKKNELLRTGLVLQTPELLFDKIDDAVIDAQMQKLEMTKAHNASKIEPVVDPEKPTVEFEDFSKMDLRIATVLEAERIPKTDKLLKLRIDTGVDQRTIISGIAEHYKPEELIGKQVCVLINLAPRKLKGVESQGMILMAKDPSGVLRLMIPSEMINNGSTVQ